MTYDKDYIIKRYKISRPASCIDIKAETENENSGLNFSFSAFPSDCLCLDNNSLTVCYCFCENIVLCSFVWFLRVSGKA